MFKPTILALLLALSAASASAQTLSNPEAVLEDLQNLGAIPEGAVPAAASSLRFRDDGTPEYGLAVFFSHIMGSGTWTARDLTVYDSDRGTYLVLSYLADDTRDSLVSKTRIVAIKPGQPGEHIAALVKAHSTGRDRSSSPHVKILEYTAKSISCTQGVYPGATASCEIEKSSP